MNTNIAAKKLIMSAYLYYRCDVSVLSDGDYDKLSVHVYDHWDELTDQLKWQLGDREGVRSTGIGILITQLGQDAAHSWYRQETGNDVERGLEQPYIKKVKGKLVEFLGDYKEPLDFGCYYAII